MPANVRRRKKLRRMDKNKNKLKLKCYATKLSWIRGKGSMNIEKNLDAMGITYDPNFHIQAERKKRYLKLKQLYRQQNKNKTDSNSNSNSNSNSKNASNNKNKHKNKTKKSESNSTSTSSSDFIDYVPRDLNAFVAQELNEFKHKNQQKQRNKKHGHGNGNGNENENENENGDGVGIAGMGMGMGLNALPDTPLKFSLEMALNSKPCNVFKPIAQHKREYYQRLINRHGRDFYAMSNDCKLNYFQYTQNKIKRDILHYKYRFRFPPKSANKYTDTGINATSSRTKL